MHWKTNDKYAANALFIMLVFRGEYSEQTPLMALSECLFERKMDGLVASSYLGNIGKIKIMQKEDNMKQPC